MKWFVIIMGLANQQYTLDNTGPWETQRACEQYLLDHPVPVLIELDGGETRKIVAMCVAEGST